MNHRAFWLLGIADSLEEYEQDIKWLVAWAPHIEQYSDLSDIGFLLAAAIDIGGAVWVHRFSGTRSCGSAASLPSL